MPIRTRKDETWEQEVKGEEGTITVTLGSLKKRAYAKVMRLFGKYLKRDEDGGIPEKPELDESKCIEAFDEFVADLQAIAALGLRGIQGVLSPNGEELPLPAGHDDRLDYLDSYIESDMLQQIATAIVGGNVLGKDEAGNSRSPQSS